MSYADEIAADLHANPITLHKLIGKTCAEVDSLRAQLADCQKACAAMREALEGCHRAWVFYVNSPGAPIAATAQMDGKIQNAIEAAALTPASLAQKVLVDAKECAEARRDGERLWQPMETAPRDGTAVLLSIEDSVDAAIFWKEQWLFRGEIPLTGEPDAWMPLPKPQAAARPSKP